MSKLIGIGELIIDFQSVGLSNLKDTKEFVKNPGGAPANVCVQVAKNGHEAIYASQVGNDGFGDFLIESLKNNGVNVDYINKTDEYDTSLAFVSFLEDGEREFCFFRKKAADLYFSKEYFNPININESDILSFGSVALKTKEAQEAHNSLIDKAIKSNALICFDPNVRLNLWEDHNELKEVIKKYAKIADVIKVSDDEALFITGESKYEDAISKLFDGNPSVILLTKGSNGADIYLKNGTKYSHNGYKVKAIDTTGAGDSFFGGFITKLLDYNVKKDNLLSLTNYDEFLDFACKCGAYTTTGYGAISAMGNKEDIESVGR
ncbi:MAG: carbohydrate kinase [Acholeplasmatales bacterium]|nr:carbohydrate kinase [Acholeplasmatales bacterium]